jgi:hypothetical protein
MALEVEELLSLWREAERVLDQLPPDVPERTLVGAEVVNLRRMYRRLTAEGVATSESLRESRSTIATAQRTLSEARRRLAGPPAP